MRDFLKNTIIIILLFLVSTWMNGQTVFRGTVIDQATNQPVVNAMVGVVNQGVGVITNEKGNFTYRKYHEVLDNESELKVSALGYKTLSNDVSVIREMINKRGVIYLNGMNDVVEPEKLSKKVAIFWDASKRGRNRDIDKEKLFLKEYVSNTTFSEISLTVFNESVVFSQTYQTPNIAYADMISVLDTIEYTGFSDFGNITYSDADTVLLVAQQKPTIGKPHINQEVPFDVVNFNAKEDAVSYFKDITTFTSGIYYDTLKNQMKAVVLRDEISATISGIVTSSNKEVNYAMVVKEGSIEEYYTNQQGGFTLPAAPGEVLTFYCLGHYPKKVVVTEKPFYNITLAAQAEILDEVELKGKRMSTPQYAYNQEKQTEIVNGRTLPIRTIYKEDFNKNAFNIADLIDGRFKIQSGKDNTGRIVASVRGACARFLVDGVETEGQSILVDNIERITVYDGGGSVIPCPARIIITTRTHPDIIDQKLRKIGIGPLRNNNYTEEVPPLEDSNTAYFKENIITGTVFSNDVAIQNVSIFKQGELKEYLTNINGEFTLPAAAGDILLLKHLGMHPKTVLITAKKTYKIFLTGKSEVLAEVQLEQKIENKDIKYDYYDEQNRVEYVGGKKYNVVEVFTKDNLNMAGFDIFSVLRSTSPRIVIVGARSKPEFQFYYRKTNTLIPLTTVVDGGYGDAYGVNPSVIERVSIYIAPNRSESRIFITTKNNSGIKKKFLDDSDITIKNNTYSEDVKQIENASNTYFNEKLIRGIVTSNNAPLQNVSIFKKGTLVEIVTAADGSFNLTATEGDILLIKHLGMFPKTVVVTKEDNYPIELINSTQVLDAVALERKEEQEQVIVQTAFGKKDRKSVGYSVDDGLSEYITPADVDFKTIAFRLPNIVVDPISGTIFHQRSFGAMKASPMMIVLDDMPISQETLRTIDPQIITDITSIGSLAGTVKYGSQAFGGVMIITTKNGKNDNASAPKRDYTVKNNDYKEEVASLNFNAIADGYIDDITQQKSIAIKLETYKKLKNDYIDKVDFYVDMALYFQNVDADAAATVRSDFAQIAGDNVKALRVLAYLNEYAGAHLAAQKLYERVLELSPSQPQSYRDVASMYQETGEYEKALELYINMLGDQIKGVDFSTYEVAIGNELKRLISLHKHKIDFNRLPNDWLAVNFNIDVRLTLNWSDPNAPFEFQFVDPKKKFYTWQSANEEDSNSMDVSEEFVVDDADSGKWLVNMRYTGQEDEVHIPPYLKYTIYKDYGTLQEKKVVKLVRLDTQLDKVTLDSFVY